MHYSISADFGKEIKDNKRFLISFKLIFYLSLLCCETRKGFFSVHFVHVHFGAFWGIVYESLL